MRFSFFGSSLVSAYWNGACTYYRGIVRALNGLGHDITFYEPDALDRQRHRDIDDPPWARVVVYPAEDVAGVRDVVAQAAACDVLIKASGVGVHDDVLEEAVLEERQDGSLAIFWDVDAPATLARLEGDHADPLRALIPDYDLILTYGGGHPVVSRYRALGAQAVAPIYNALDPTTHHPVPPQPQYRAELSALVNRLPDREARVREFFFSVVAALPEKKFLLAGAGWDDWPHLPNLARLGHLPPTEHNAFNCSALAVLNVTRDSMASNGFSPPTRVFEAAGAGACLITDRWEGLECFLEPGREVIACGNGQEVAAVLRDLEPGTARELGDRARRRVLDEHTYAHRARDVERVLEGRGAGAAPGRSSS